MLTALVAVVASVGPQVKNLFEANGDLFTARYAGHRDTAIIVLANNHTSKKALLVHASIEKRFIVEPANPGPGNTAFENFFVGFSAKAGSIVNAHDSGEVVLEVDRGTTRSSIQAMRREEAAPLVSCAPVWGWMLMSTQSRAWTAAMWRVSRPRFSAACERSNNTSAN